MILLNHRWICWTSSLKRIMYFSNLSANYLYENVEILWKPKNIETNFRINSLSSCPIISIFLPIRSWTNFVAVKHVFWGIVFTSKYFSILNVRVSNKYWNNMNGNTEESPTITMKEYKVTKVSVSCLFLTNRKNFAEITEFNDRTDRVRRTVHN